MYSNKEFILCIKDIKNNEDVLKMKGFVQHYSTSCYEHCYKVAFLSYLICKKFHFGLYGCCSCWFLHDLFLYDWHIKCKENKRFLTVLDIHTLL